MEFRNHHRGIILILLINMYLYVNGDMCCKTKKQDAIFQKEEEEEFSFYENKKNDIQVVDNSVDRDKEELDNYLNDEEDNKEEGEEEEINAEITNLREKQGYINIGEGEQEQEEQYQEIHGHTLHHNDDNNERYQVTISFKYNKKGNTALYIYLHKVYNGSCQKEPNYFCSIIDPKMKGENINKKREFLRKILNSCECKFIKNKQRENIGFLFYNKKKNWIYFKFQQL